MPWNIYDKRGNKIGSVTKDTSGYFFGCLFVIAIFLSPVILATPVVILIGIQHWIFPSSVQVNQHKK